MRIFYIARQRETERVERVEIKTQELAWVRCMHAGKETDKGLAGDGAATDMINPACGALDINHRH